MSFGVYCVAGLLQVMKGGWPALKVKRLLVLAACCLTGPSRVSEMSILMRKRQPAQGEVSACMKSVHMLVPHTGVAFSGQRGAQEELGPRLLHGLLGAGPCCRLTMAACLPVSWLRSVKCCCHAQ